MKNKDIQTGHLSRSAGITGIEELARATRVAPSARAGRMARWGAGLLAAVLALPALAAEGRWTEGFGQGDLEYFIDAQGMRLYIGCPTADGSADTSSSLALMSVKSSQEVTKFTLKVGGRSYDGPFTADSRVGENDFIALLDDLRKGDAVVTYAGKTLTFPKNNAAKVLPAFGKKGFACNLS